MIGIVWNTVTAFGTGVFLKCVSNAMLKDRYFARPWNHLLLGGAFGYIGYNYDKWEMQLIDLVNEKRHERGMPIMTRMSVFPEIEE
jgi:hypothetical protein